MTLKKTLLIAALVALPLTLPLAMGGWNVCQCGPECTCSPCPCGN